MRMSVSWGRTGSFHFASGLSDRLTLNGEKISEALANLLCSVLFNPLLENGQFPRESFLQEQRQTLEMLDAEYNDKRIYAKQRCEELMCAEEPYGVGRCGTKEQIAALSREDLLPAWKRLVETARIEVMAMGDCNTTRIYELFCQAVARLGQRRGPALYHRKCGRCSDGQK